MTGVSWKLLRRWARTTIQLRTERPLRPGTAPQSRCATENARQRPRTAPPPRTATAPRSSQRHWNRAAPHGPHASPADSLGLRPRSSSGRASSPVPSFASLTRTSRCGEPRGRARFAPQPRRCGGGGRSRSPWGAAGERLARPSLRKSELFRALVHSVHEDSARSRWPSLTAFARTWGGCGEDHRGVVLCGSSVAHVFRCVVGRRGSGAVRSCWCGSSEAHLHRGNVRGCRSCTAEPTPSIADRLAIALHSQVLFQELPELPRLAHLLP